MNSFQNGIIANFSILSDSDRVINTLSNTAKAKIRISGYKDIPNDGGIRSDISRVGNDRLQIL